MTTRLTAIALAAAAAFFAADAFAEAPKKQYPPRSSLTRRAAAAKQKPAAKPQPAKSAAMQRQKAKAAQPAAPTPYRKSPYVGVIAVDAATGRVLFSDNSAAKAYPASVTKLMTAFLVLEDVRAGRLLLSDKITASPVKSRTDAHYRQPSCVGLKAGESMDLDSMLKALLVHSANDAAIFIAERCSGSVEAFVARMNEKAASLGMASTRYFNPNGLPPPANAKERNFNFSTCEDQAKLAVAILAQCPEILRYTSLKTCDMVFPDGRSQRFINHNNVMVKNKLKVMNPDGTEAVDGLKTGYINAGGSSVVLTGKRAGKRVVVVVLGSSSSAERDEVAATRMADALDAVNL
jgi:D-alanyl-D-alanine carboxypeptidase